MIRTEAAQLDLRHWIHPGDDVVVGQGAAEPQTLSEALVRQRLDLGGLSAFLGVQFTDTFIPGLCDGLSLRSMGGVGTNRRLVKAGLLDLLACHQSQLPGFIETGVIGCDVALVQVSPPDAQGRYRLSLGVDYIRTAVDQARVVIAELNHALPQVVCDGALVEADIDVLVETRRPLIQLASAPVGELERSIAAHVEAYIPDRATLQVGLGAIPEAIVAMLANRQGLGVHSGMVGDSLVDLVECGAVTNAHKGIDAGVSITGMLMGTDARLYRWARDNLALRVCGIRYTHTPRCSRACRASYRSIRRWKSI